MSERKSIMTWANLQNSVNFNHDLFDSNSRCKIKEQSISQAHKFYLSHFQDSCQPYLPFSIENTINFSDLDRRIYQSNQSYQRNQDYPKETNLQNWAPTEDYSIKGLRNLAFLLLRTLRKKKFSSHKQVVEQIEMLILCKSNKGHDNHAKEEKNIKRRIYDALNVMIAARILQRQFQSIQLTNHSHFISRNYSIVNRRNQQLDKMNQISARIQRKRELCLKLQSQRQALRLWTDKKARLKQQEKQRLFFPLIMLFRSSKEKVRMQLEQQGVILNHNNLLIYSEVDLLQNIYEANYLDKQQKTSVKREQEYIDEMTYI